MCRASSTIRGPFIRWMRQRLSAEAATLEDLERAAIGTADNRWRIPG